MASIKSAVSHERGEVRADWSGFLVHTCDEQADSNTKTNRFTKSSPCYSTRST